MLPLDRSRSGTRRAGARPRATPSSCSARGAHARDELLRHARHTAACCLAGRARSKCGRLWSWRNARSGARARACQDGSVDRSLGPLSGRPSPLGLPAHEPLPPRDVSLGRPRQPWSKMTTGVGSRARAARRASMATTSMPNLPPALQRVENPTALGPVWRERERRPKSRNAKEGHSHWRA